MKNKARTIAGVVLAGLMAIAPLAGAAPPHGEGGHTHHVHTGNGCLDVDSVTFFIDDRGLHRGANSSGAEQAIWHGPCH